MKLSRRALIGSALAGLSFPARASTASGRRFLFVHCSGGWDTPRVFQPNFGSSVVDMEAEATLAEVGGISFVDHPDRPAVRRFFEDYAARSCVINGIEVRSITHERCRRIISTGVADGAADDWGSTLAAAAGPEVLLPYFVMSGTAFTAEHSDRVVRLGSSGQLGKLLDGTVLTDADTPFPMPSASRSARVDAFVRQRFGAATSPIAVAGAHALDDIEALADYAGVLDIGGYASGCYALPSQLATAFDVFELGLARSALIEYEGWCAQGWDTHSNGDLQSMHYEELFDALIQGLQDLDGRTGTAGTALADEVTIVLFSEMGRTPATNATGGRDHWTFTSALLLGAGVQGGQGVGGYDTQGFGVGIDYNSGAVSDGGTGILAANFGATILALGDVDPGENAPIMGVLA